jgi:hypothetical protein
MPFFHESGIPETLPRTVEPAAIGSERLSFDCPAWRTTVWGGLDRLRCCALTL